ncbi:hypothetical protein VTL71DRAFT_12539, partial [Oculimacula yallundae]
MPRVSQVPYDGFCLLKGLISWCAGCEDRDLSASGRRYSSELEAPQLHDMHSRSRSSVIPVSVIPVLSISNTRWEQDCTTLLEE